MEESEKGVTQPKKQRRSWRPLVLVGGVVLLLFLVSGVLTGLNAFGRNISGTVTCVNGDVMGVYIEAERVPRIGSDFEVQSGFAEWRLTSTSTQVAEFEFWLAWDGAYSVHVGCGTLRKPGTARGWATDNRTVLPVYIRRSVLTCGHTLNEKPETVVTTDCRPV